MDATRRARRGRPSDLSAILAPGPMPTDDAPHDSALQTATSAPLPLPDDAARGTAATEIAAATEGAAAGEERLPPRERLAVGIAVVAFAIAAAGFLVLFVSFFVWGPFWGWHGSTTSILVRLLGMGTWSSGIGVAFHALRWQSLQARAREEPFVLADARPDVLVLRSFRDDALTENVGSIIPFVWGPPVPLEERLLSSFAQRGLLAVALDRGPRDRTALVARRIAVPDEAWRETVTDLLDRSRRVLVIVGKGEGLTWEIDLLRRRARLDDALFVLPRCDQAERALRWATLLPHLAGGELTATLPPRGRSWPARLLGRPPLPTQALQGARALAAAEIGGLTCDEGAFRAWREDVGPSAMVKEMLAGSGDPRLPQPSSTRPRALTKDEAA